VAEHTQVFRTSVYFLTSRLFSQVAIYSVIRNILIGEPKTADPSPHIHILRHALWQDKDADV
jgi:hypothetical protein